jgi:deoxyribose-phosphate aldolase
MSPAFPPEIEDILSRLDHTCLRQDSVWNDIEKLLDEGMKYRTASVCIPPSFVRQASDYIQKNNEKYEGYKVRICTVIGFPNGYSTTETKVFEANDAVKNGAGEIDMVLNLGLVKAGRFGEILHEINLIGTACDGRRLKVIIETGLLTDEEKIRLVEVICTSYAEFIKTSTGFSKGGATVSDVELIKSHIKNGRLIKASGGIHTIEEAKALIAAGADRLGASSLVSDIVKRYGETS